MDTMVIITTTVGQHEAKEMANKLVGAGAVACVNIMPPHTAIYRWEGKQVEDPTEVMLVCKTLVDNLDVAVDLIEKIHPYELPVIEWWEVGSTPAAIAWAGGK